MAAEILGLFQLSIVMQIAYIFLLYTDRKPMLTFIVGALTVLTWYTTAQTVLSVNQVQGIPISYLLSGFSTINVLPLLGLVYNVLAPRTE